MGVFDEEEGWGEEVEVGVPEVSSPSPWLPFSVLSCLFSDFDSSSEGLICKSTPKISLWRSDAEFGSEGESGGWSNK